MPDQPTNESENALFIVGVGASAGGLDALANLVATLPDNERLAVVVVQHVSPDHESKMVGLLSRHARWPVVVAEDQQPIQGMHVYVTPPNREITVVNGYIVLSQQQRTVHAVPSVDRFLTSLAEDRKQQAIAIILSGTGKDGSQGVADIQEHGGYVIAQQPTEAQHKGMPESAIQTGQVNTVLEVREMGARLNERVNNPQVATGHASETSLQGIFRLMTSRLGTDFSKYKPSTISRRINKRLEALSIDSINDYYSHIQDNPDEIDTLFQTVLIGVTRFFRDESTFKQIRKYAEELIADKEPGEAIRAWSVGCASGEEPYSIAIMIAELLGENIGQHPIQIFATDIDEKALATGRRGFYSEAVTEDLTEEQRDKYFIRTANGYEIKKSLRQWVLFSKHDISSDPPFVRLDLILCRNLLIYFDNELQQKVIPLFHYGLRSDGYLLLGKSENITQLSNLFGKEDSKHKIFKKREGIELNTLSYGDFRQFDSKRIRNKNTSVRSTDLTLEELTNQALVSTYEHPFLVVNEAMDVVYLRGKLQPYINLSKGSLKANALKIINSALHMELRTTFVKAKRESQTHKSRIVRFASYGQEHLVCVAVRPFAYQRDGRDYFLVIFERVNPLSQYPFSADEFITDRGQTQDALRVMELEHELASTKEHLQTFTEELETSNEELQAMNEELQSANEELKSSNEELETSNEELQSANEELQTANSELAISNENLVEQEAELLRTQEDLEMSRDRFRLALDNSPIALFYQDHSLRYTWQYNQLLGFDSTTVVGKTDHELFSPEYQHLIDLKKNVLDTANSARIEVMRHDRWYDLIIEPVYHRQAVVGVKGMAINITKQKRAQQEMEQSQAVVRSIVDESDESILAIDLEYQVLLGNPNQKRVFMEFFGQDLNPGDNILQLLKDYPDLQANTHKMFANAFRGERSSLDSYQSARTDEENNPRYYDIDIVPIRKADNTVLGGALISREVTQKVLSKQQMEGIIARSANLIGDEFFKNLTQQVTSLFQVKYVYVGLLDEHKQTVHTRALRIDGKLIRNFSYTLQNVPCQAVANSQEPWYIEQVSQQFPDDPKLQRWNAESYLGIPVTSPLSGETLAILVMIDTKPLREVPDSDYVLKVFSLRAGAEIERMRAEQQLQEKERQISNITNNVGDVIFESVTPAEGEPYFRFVSQAIQDVYEIHPDELSASAQKAFEAIHPEDRPEFMRLNDEALQQGSGTFMFEGRVIAAKSGTLKWVYISAKVERQENGDVVWYGSITDVTKLKQTQQELNETKEQAEQAARAKEDFLATMSHEIRTPLNAIIGLSGLLIDHDPRPEQLNNLRALRFSSESLMALVNDILDFSKIEAGKVEVEQIPFSLASLLTSLQQAHQIHAEEGRNELKIEQAPDVPTLIVGDPVKLGQVLNNLLSNALKFTKHGRVLLSVSLEEAHEDERTLLFSVQDTGVGIAPDKVARIFNKFTQADNSTQRHFGGTGLGLSITKMLLELMGSAIQVESEPGQGARFYFSITVRRTEQNTVAPETPAGALPDSQKSSSDLRLLIVEDVAVNRMILQQYLEDRLGITADEAINGEGAVRLVSENDYDLILMDVRMPVMDGYEATRLIRAMDARKQDLPIIALTADTSETVKSSKAAYFTDVVTKPFNPNELFAKISRYGQSPVAEPTNGVDKVPAKTSEMQIDFENAEQQFRKNEQRVSFYRIVSNVFQEHKTTLQQAVEERDAKRLEDLLHKLRTTVALLGLDTLGQQLEYCFALLTEDSPAAEVDQAYAQSVLLFDQVIERVDQRRRALEETSQEA